MGKSPFKIVVESSSEQEEELVPVRLHVGGTISHIFVNTSETIDELKSRLMREFEVKSDPAKTRLEVKLGIRSITLQYREQLLDAIEKWKLSKTPKMEIFVEIDEEQKDDDEIDFNDEDFNL